MLPLAVEVGGDDYRPAFRVVTVVVDLALDSRFRTTPLKSGLLITRELTSHWPRQRGKWAPLGEMLLSRSAAEGNRLFSIGIHLERAGSRRVPADPGRV